jgi:hypothetical protein
MTTDAIDRTRRTTSLDRSESDDHAAALPKPAPWHQDVPVTTNDPVDLGLVFKNMLEHPDREAVMFLGMNTEAATVERGALEAHAHVVTIASNLNAESNKVTWEGHAYNLVPTLRPDGRVRSDAEQLFLAMRMPKELATRIAEHMDSMKAGTARTEIAEVAGILWQGETATIPSRLLVSGHSGDGAQAWGHGSMHFAYDDLRFLARALPKGAAQIEDIQIGTCSSLSNVTLDLAEWRDAFPNLKTVWAYETAAGFQPTNDQAEWERQTRGRSDTFTTTRAMAEKHVVTWSAGDGKTRGLTAASHLLDEKTIADRRIDKAVRGEPVDAATLDHDYRVYREIQQRSDIDSGIRADARRAADQLLRLRYYDAVATKFQRVHATEIAALARATGVVPAPDFSRLSRTEALAAIKRLEIAKPEDDLAPAALATLKLLKDGFAKLNASVIPESWCQHDTQARRH